MAICQFFLQGRCRFGDRCWNEHPRGGGRYGPAAPQHQGTSGGGGAWGTTNQRYTSVIQPSTFKSNTWGGSRDHGRGFFGSPDFGSSGSSSRNASFSQNRFSALMNSQNTADGYKDEEERLLESIVKDMEIWESSGQWIFSSYSPMKEKPNVSGFRDFSPEELHLEYYNCTANNNIQSYINSVQQLAKQWKDRLLQLKTLTASTKAALLSELKNTVTQPLPAFGFGGQQTSSFGLSSFPVISNSNSASSFSFKTSSSLISTSSGNTPAFGSSSASCNPPPFGVTSSPSVSHSVGFGSLAAPSAASSFKTSATTSGFGTSGFSGFGNSSAVNFSGTTLLTALGASNAAAGASSSDSSSTLFGQTASNAAVGTSSSTLFGQTASNAAVGTSSSTLFGQTASNAAVGTSSSTLFGQTASNAAVGTSSSDSSSTLFGQTASNAAVGTSSSDSSSTLSGQTASNAAVGTSPSDSSSTSSGQTASASGHNVTSASSAVTNNTTSEKLFTPKSELSAEELKQFEAKKFTVGKIPFKPPPSELLNV